MTLTWPLYLLLPTRYTNDWLNASAALGFIGVLLAVATAGGAGYAAARWGWAVAIRDRVQAGALAGLLAGMIAYAAVGAGAAGVVTNAAVYWNNGRPVGGDEPALSILVTLAWWQGTDVSALLMNSEAGQGQPWRLVTSALPHVDLLHLAFNLYWLWVFGTLVEGEFGPFRTAGVLVLFAAGSAAAEYAVFEGGVGLSGVGYGLFGLLWVLSRKDQRFHDAVDQQTVLLFLGWFVLCILMTKTGAWRVGNVAHGMGAVLGVLLGLAVAAGERKRFAYGCLVGLAVIGATLAATVWRPDVNFSPNRGMDLVAQGYREWQQGESDEAMAHLTAALRMNPTNAYAYSLRGQVHAQRGDLAAAIADLSEALRLNPQDGAAYASRAWAHAKNKQYAQAAADYTEAVRLNPKDAAALNALAWLRATCAQAALRDGRKAVELAKQACELTTWKDPNLIDTLAAASAEAGDYPEAVRWQKQALAAADFPEAERDRARQRLQLYEARKPYREE